MAVHGWAYVRTYVRTYVAGWALLGMAVIGCAGRGMAGPGWAWLGIAGCALLCMAGHGCARLGMAGHGWAWLCMAGHIWLCMAGAGLCMAGHVCACVCMCVHVCACVCTCDNVCACLCVCNHWLELLVHVVLLCWPFRKGYSPQCPLLCNVIGNLSTTCNSQRLKLPSHRTTFKVSQIGLRIWDHGIRLRASSSGCGPSLRLHRMRRLS